MMIYKISISENKYSIVDDLATFADNSRMASTASLLRGFSAPPYSLEGGPRTLASAVYHQLRADVIACRYQPGEKLLIGSLAKTFDVSAVRC